MPSPDTFDVVKAIDESPIGAYQWAILVLCGLCMVLDGFDVQAMGYVAPALLQAWSVDKASLGPVFGAGLLGLLLGSLALSVVADRVGRRPILIASTFFFSVCMLATPMARDVQQLLAMRFVTGLGLGAIMPNAMALCGEFSPQRRRVLTMMLISCGFTVGAMVGGVVAAALIPRLGWQSVFYVGGAVPLVIAIAMLAFLPESIQFQVLKGVDPQKAAAVLRRLVPGKTIPANAELQVSGPKLPGAPVVALFSDGRGLGTVALWAISFLNLIALYFLSSWLPTIAKLAGLGLEKAVLVGATLQLGGTLGTVAMGWVIDRLGFKRILLPCFVVAACAIALIGHAAASVALLFSVVFVTGFAVVGGQPAINAMAANYYPTTLRTTGVGWCLGIGRIGSIVGPVVGGELLGLNWSQSALFLLAALPSAVIVLVLLLGAPTERMPTAANRP